MSSGKDGKTERARRAKDLALERLLDALLPNGEREILEASRWEKSERLAGEGNGGQRFDYIGPETPPRDPSPPPRLQRPEHA